MSNLFEFCPLGFDCSYMGKTTPERGCINYTDCGMLCRYEDFPYIFFEKISLANGCRASESDLRYYIRQEVLECSPPFWVAESIPYEVYNLDVPEIRSLWVRIDDEGRGFAKPEKLPYEKDELEAVLTVRDNLSLSAIEAGWSPAIFIPVTRTVFSRAKMANDYEQFCELVDDVFFEFVDSLGVDNEEDYV